MLTSCHVNIRFMSTSDLRQHVMLSCQYHLMSTSDSCKHHLMSLTCPLISFSCSYVAETDESNESKKLEWMPCLASLVWLGAYITVC